MMKEFLIIIFLLLFSTSVFSQEGLIKTYYASGKMESEITYHKNVRDGIAKFYYENGNLKQELTYANGKIDGLVKNYAEKGKVLEVLTVVNGKREGSSSFYKENGSLIGDVTYKNGAVFVEPKVKEEEFVEEFAPGDSMAAKNVADEKTFPVEIKEKGIDTSLFHTDYEVAPEPANGPNSIKRRLYYPQRARDAKIEGVVNVEAMINEWGDVVKATVIKGLGYGCDDAAQTVIFYTKFKPAMIKGKTIKSKIVLPVEFKLSEYK